MTLPNVHKTLVMEQMAIEEEQGEEEAMPRQSRIGNKELDRSRKYAMRLVISVGQSCGVAVKVYGVLEYGGCLTRW